MSAQIKLTSSLTLDVGDFAPQIAQYLERQLTWLAEISRELAQWKLEEDNRDYLQTVHRYFYLFTLPVVEICFDNISEPRIQPITKMLLWSVLHFRFLDDVLDNDNNGLGFETSVFLSHYCLGKSLEILQSQKVHVLSADSYFKQCHKVYAFQVQMSRPYEKVDFSTFSGRHWERGSVLFWLPEQILSSDRVRSGRSQESLDFLRAYFDFMLAPGDLSDLFNDNKNRINTPATILFNESRGDTGMTAKFCHFRDGYFKWAEKRLARAMKLADKYRFKYSWCLLQRAWSSFILYEKYFEEPL
jgi:hypothetical protein